MINPPNLSGKPGQAPTLLVDRVWFDGPTRKDTSLEKPPKGLGTLDELRLFTGVPQHENFCRMAELVPTRRMAPSSSPVEWALGPELVLHDTFEHEGRARSVERLLDETDTAALLVVHRGRIVHEEYRLTGGPHVPWMSMSVAKSFVSALVGIAVDEGSIASIEDPVSDYVEVEPGSAYDGVAIRSLLQMSSGARWDEDYSNPDADAKRIGEATSGAHGGHDRIVATMVRELPPDTFCRYNSCDTQALASVVRAATGTSLADYMQTRLVEPLGMTDPGAWIVDPFGVEMGYAGLNLTARDYARFGELYRRGGVAGDAQVVPAQWVATSVVSTAPHTDPGRVVEASETLAEGYGYQWWIPAVGDGSFSAIGVYNQFVYVHPAHEVVVVKLSANRAYGTTVHEEQNREGETLAFLAHCAAWAADA